MPGPCGCWLFLVLLRWHAFLPVSTVYCYLSSVSHPSCPAAAVHSSKTKNLQKFLWHICGLLRRASKSRTVQRVADALYLTRIILKYLTEFLTAAQLSTLLKTDAADAPPGAQADSNGMKGLPSFQLTCCKVLLGFAVSEREFFCTGYVQPALLQALVRAVIELLAFGDPRYVCLVCLDSCGRLQSQHPVAF